MAAPKIFSTTFQSLMERDSSRLANLNMGKFLVACLLDLKAFQAFLSRLALLHQLFSSLRPYQLPCPLLLFPYLYLKNSSKREFKTICLTSTLVGNATGMAYSLLFKGELSVVVLHLLKSQG
ncbi:hypothetical protein PanWU01x14_093620 [Parasponia andersonii]|uniref:Uncharacterized protein n=1 Tax=Parasponia andersonii TaxID=3476 RepID=A0A2P5D671_PARAD|nr:hypothetical protein PanWU01x14_093620 [Parasponia andersonii]